MSEIPTTSLESARTARTPWHLGEFTLERVALHVINLADKEPRLSEDEIDLAALTSEEDLEVLEQFFAGHLENIWNAPETNQTLTASFDAASEIARQYKVLRKDDTDFFWRSCTMAHHLYDTSQQYNTAKSISPGLLMVLWFRKTGHRKPFLALFKMNPGRDLITFQRKKGYALELAVQHIREALPEAGDPLKWALIPDPTRTAFGLKLSDRQARRPAEYFKAFLGCPPQPSQKQQVATILETVPSYVREHHPTANAPVIAQRVFGELENAAKDITPKVVGQELKKVLPNLREKAFEQALRENNEKKLEEDLKKPLKDAEVPRLAVAPQALRKTKMLYELSGGIKIRGPRAAMERIEEIPLPDGQVRLCIDTAPPKKSYVW